MEARGVEYQGTVFVWHERRHGLSRTVNVSNILFPSPLKSVTAALDSVEADIPTASVY
jgi:hypothetical protein